MAAGGPPSADCSASKFGLAPPGPKRSQRPDRVGMAVAARGAALRVDGAVGDSRGACLASKIGHCAAAGNDTARASAIEAAACAAVRNGTAAAVLLRHELLRASFSLDEPANSFLPSASVTVLALPTSGLFLARWPVTVDGVADLHRVAVPAAAHEAVRARELEVPVHGLAGVVLARRCRSAHAGSSIRPS